MGWHRKAKEMTDPILGFHGDHKFMSNFEPAHVRLGDYEWYPTTEHAYQAAKTMDWDERRAIKFAKTPGIAKRLGQKVTKRADWEQVKEQVMRDLLIQKFKLPHYRDQLLATGDAYLEETNTWNDVYWGVCKGQGKNRLGYILMEIREALKSDRENSINKRWKNFNCTKL